MLWRCPFDVYRHHFVQAHHPERRIPDARMVGHLRPLGGREGGRRGMCFSSSGVPEPSPTTSLLP